MKEHIDYEKENALRVWHLNQTGGAAKDGLTVEDYFAAEAMKSIAHVLYERFANGDEDEFRYMEVAETAYDIAQAMMRVRNPK